MDRPTAFYQEVYEALTPLGVSSRELEGITITVTETCDSESYRIDKQHVDINLISYWEGQDWDTVLAECVASYTNAF